MNETHRVSARLDDNTAGTFARVDVGRVAVTPSFAATLLETALNADSLSVETAVSTDNAARPKSIITGDCIVDDNEYVYEILRTAQLDTSDVPIETNDDGTMSMRIDDIQEHARLAAAYDTVDVRLYEA